MAQIVLFGDKMCAVIECDNLGYSPASLKINFKDCLVNAIIEWSNNTSEGKEAIENAMSQFNIIDLMNELNDGEQPFDYVDTLTPFLHKHGIYGLSITIYNEAPDEDWNFNTILLKK